MFDIIFISYQEPNAEENFKQLQNRFPIAQRVHGISKKKAQKMIDSSFDPRDATRSYTLSIQAQAVATNFNPTAGLVCSISLMQQKNDDYVDRQRDKKDGEDQQQSLYMENNYFNES